MNATELKMILDALTSVSGDARQVLFVYLARSYVDSVLIAGTVLTTLFVVRGLVIRYNPTDLTLVAQALGTQRRSLSGICEEAEDLIRARNRLNTEVLALRQKVGELERAQPRKFL